MLLTGRLLIAFLILFAHSLWLCTAKVPPASVLNKACPAGCTDHGNCNGETGECDCRFGFGGSDCSKRLMPACHSTPQIADSIPGFGHFFPKNCYCLKQLGEAGCNRPFWNDPRMCDYFLFWDWDNMRCYVIKDAPEEQQFSTPPDGPTDPRYQWKRGRYNRTTAQAGAYPFELVDATPPVPYELPNQDVLLPIDRCPNSCSGNGWCVTPHREGPKDPVCRCHGFFGGSSCEQPLEEHCYLGCSGRGRCSGGYCHCQPGYWGLGCSRSKAYVADTWLPHPTKLKIYVYELPERIAYRKPWHDDPALIDTMYLAEVAFVEQLLGDWAVRTENPWEANLFLINTYTIYYIGNIGFPGHHFHTVFNYVRTHFPFWNMTGGRNHIAISTNDRGCCDLYQVAHHWPEVQAPIKLVHFGQAGRYGRSGHHTDSALEAAAREFRRISSQHAGAGGGVEGAGGEGAADLDSQDLQGEVVRFRGLPAYSLEAIRMEREPCFRPEQDIAFPNWLGPGWMVHAREVYEDVGGRMRPRALKRPYLFYFHGFSKSDMAYSGGVRQGIFAMFGNTTREDVALNKGSGGEWMLKSRFCLAPLGYGWGIRLTQAMHTGCVPVLIQDHIYTAFWDILPYEKFSVRINRHNLHRLFDLLDAITPEQLADLQQGMADYYRHFSWHSNEGGIAYNTTIASLHRRLLNLWTALFRGIA